MSSTTTVNFSIRSNKTIERSIVFDCVRELYARLDLEKPVYVGLGSVWFSDFDLAHRIVGIETMLSIEADPVIFKRALFNRPCRTLKVIEGTSQAVVKSLLLEDDLNQRPSVILLDFDKTIDEDRLEELAELVWKLPRNSTLITTFSGLGHIWALLLRSPRVLSGFSAMLLQTTCLVMFAAIETRLLGFLPSALKTSS